MANALSGCEGTKIEAVKLKENEWSLQLGGDFERMRKECGHLGNLKNVADLGQVDLVIQLQKEKTRKEEVAISN